MMKLLAVSTFLFFIFLSLIHIYWGFGGKVGSQKVIPEVNGKPVFIPGRLITIVVALAFVMCGSVLLILAFSSHHNLLFQYSTYAGWLLACIFLLRAIGDFDLVGFFKKVKGTEFAKYDSLFYSPLCLVISLIFAVSSYNI